jgi:anhydro-N-acetylmuramic acid kinase
VQGRAIEPLLERWRAHPALQRKPPRSLSLDDFGDAFLAQGVAEARKLERGLHDVLCTATHFVAQAVAEAIERFIPAKPARVILSGGGTRNGFLLRLLEQRLAPLSVEKLDAHGCPAEAREAVAHAGLTLLTLDGVPGSVPSVTGASGPRLLGSVTPGSTRNWARCLNWMAQQMTPLHAAAA